MFNLEIENNLCLKSMINTNAEELFAFIDSNREHLRKFLGWVDSIKTVEDEQKFIDFLKKDETSLAFVIFDGDKIIGSIGFLCIDKLNNNAQIGYCIDKKYQGKGIVTKTCKRLIQYGFEVLNLERIEFRIAKDNRKSIAIMNKISAVYEGLLRKVYLLNNDYIDCAVYSVLKS